MLLTPGRRGCDPAPVRRRAPFALRLSSMVHFSASPSSWYFLLSILWNKHCSHKGKQKGGPALRGLPPTRLTPHSPALLPGAFGLLSLCKNRNLEMRVLVSYFLTPKLAHQIIPYFALTLSLLSDVSGKYYDFSSQGASSFLPTGTGGSTGLGKSPVYLARSSDPATRRFPRVSESRTTPSGSHLAEVRAHPSAVAPGVGH